ncbi:uncharacterized protein EHS24_002181 [Apiotrichum porosum]|uniref:ATPase inhibitor, mitochondrial n=1 Tax=Apiotrichum porosum TaxID=105984 RepID=A0A427XHZ9_9TREE|nr:uncharacterized protein EHS24_002181 [Apiotrichum porosum]RSH78456.1 hypothetical protein EHS24_002181 [Apiotrichum porosum]
MARSYTDVRGEGATASSKGFSQREQAEEGQYIRRREQELLKAAQEKLKAAQAEVDKHQATVDASNAKDKK